MDLRAQSIANTIAKIVDALERMEKYTKEGSALWRKIEDIGGDPSGLAAAGRKLTETMAAFEEADMYARAHLDMDKVVAESMPVAESKQTQSPKSNNDAVLYETVDNLKTLAGVRH